MNIYISDEYSNISEELKSRGYNVFNVLDNGVCNAIICNIKTGNLTNIIGIENYKDKNIILIDGSKKTADDIENILNNRINV